METPRLPKGRRGEKIKVRLRAVGAKRKLICITHNGAVKTRDRSVLRIPITAVRGVFTEAIPYLCLLRIWIFPARPRKNLFLDGRVNAVDRRSISGVVFIEDVAV